MKNSTSTGKSKSARKSSVLAKRPLHRRISLHPISLLFLLCVGVLMTVSTFKTFGATTNFSMSITASPITDPAIIDKPKDQERFSVPDIDVKGTCPTDSYVKLYNNGTFSGVAPCQSGKFEFNTTLTSGYNQLSVKVYNFSDQEGPASGSIVVYYDASLTPTQTAGPSTSRKTLNPADRLRILTDYKYKVHKNGQPVRLDLELSGGSSPYAVAVYWNDNGKITPISRSDRSPFMPEHIYTEKPRMQTYVIKVAASDVEGNSDYIQLMAVVDGEKPDDRFSSAATAPPSSNSTGGIRTLLKYMWPAYLIVVLMVLSFYLGEREERRILLRKNQKPMFR